MSMEINNNLNYSKINEDERLRAERTDRGKETENVPDKMSGLQDEYISSEKAGEKPSGLYRLGQDEEGNPKILYDDPKNPKNAKEKCIGNTDKVEREIRELKERKKELEQQIRTAGKDEEKVRELEKELAELENELSRKDTDTYRRQNTTFTEGN